MSKKEKDIINYIVICINEFAKQCKITSLYYESSSYVYEYLKDQIKNNEENKWERI